MKLRLKVPALLGAAVLLTGGTGAAAYALVAQTSDSPTRTGNELPIDDNHKAVVPTRSPEAAETEHPVEASSSPRTHETPRESRSPEPQETAADHGTQAAPEATHTAHRGSGSSGSHDAIPEPSEASKTPEPTESPEPAESPEAHGSGHGGGGGSGHGGGSDHQSGDQGGDH